MPNIVYTLDHDPEKDFDLSESQGLLLRAILVILAVIVLGAILFVVIY